MQSPHGDNILPPGLEKAILAEALEGPELMTLPRRVRRTFCRVFLKLTFEHFQRKRFLFLEHAIKQIEEKQVSKHKMHKNADGVARRTGRRGALCILWD